MTDIWMNYRHVRPPLNMSRLVVLGVAVVAGVSAAYIASTSGKPTVVQMMAPSAPALKTVEVLVVKASLGPGSLVKAADMQWQLWPADGTNPAMITRDARPQAMQELEGSRLRAAIEAGEPLRAERLARDQGGGVMSTMLRPGFRAIAINIDSRGATTAGGFILPNDHVDVIKVMRDEAASKAQGGDVLVSETLFKNVRVLAIGRTYREQEGGGDVSGGDTATLEMDPRQAEQIFLAQRTGHLTLTLRSIEDVKPKTAEPVEDNRTVQVRYSSGAIRRFNCSDGACSDGK